MTRDEQLRAYAAHVPECKTCKHANVVGELCPEGLALWRQVEQTPDDPEAVAFHCFKPARVELYEVISDGAGHTLTPLGIFCDDHWTIERAFYRRAGARTGMRVAPDSWLCCWEPARIAIGESGGSGTGGAGAPPSSGPGRIASRPPVLNKGGGS